LFTRRPHWTRPGASGPIGKRGSTRRDSRGLHIRCPHCQNPVELLADSPIEEITCGACGDPFSLVDRDGPAGEVAPLKKIGRFELVARLGVGGFGTVWKARDTELDRAVALKLPRKGQLSSQEAVQFFREARAAAQLKHPHIVPVHEVGRDDDTIFIVTDLIHGMSLAAWVEDDPISAREAATLCAVIAEALHFAHEQGVIHRDLKPSNVMIDESGQPHLMDFGLAKREVGEITMTVEGQILGTPAYMSPEQAKGQSQWIDRRTDIYSLGVVLFQLLTRELPFRGGVQRQIQTRILEDAPNPRKLNAHVPVDLATISLKCLERDPNRRYSTARELADELRRFLKGEPIKARPISSAARVWRWAKRNPALSAALLLTVFLAIAGPLAAVAIEGGRRAIRARLQERDELIADYDRKIRDQSSQLAALKRQRDAQLNANPGVETFVPLWRQKLIADYLSQHEASIVQTLKSDPLSEEAQAQAHVGLAYMLREINRPQDALSQFAAATLVLARLAEQDLDDERFRIALADCFAQMSELQSTGDHKLAAIESAERALSIREDLAHRHPLAADLQIDYLNAMIEALIVKSPAVRGAELEQLRKKLEQGWSANPSALYKLGCYLTLRPPLLLTDEQNSAE
jgi:hypothetical protein